MAQQHPHHHPSHYEYPQPQAPVALVTGGLLSGGDASSARPPGPGVPSAAATAAAVAVTTPTPAHPLLHPNFQRPPSRNSSFEADDEQSATSPRSSRSRRSSNLDSDDDDDDGNDDNDNRAFRLLSAMPRHRPPGPFGPAGNGDDEEDQHNQHPLHRNSRSHHHGPSYPGEDTRPTSAKEILGWYMYAFASETYVVCAISSFIPILLETLARENGVLLSDHTTPCKSSSSTTKEDGQCVVYVLGLEINTASFAMYTFSISVLLQALLVVSISCAADHGNYRKTLLLIFAWAGSISVMLYLAISARVYILGALLAIVSNTSFGASFVLLNSFLPLLVRHHPKVLFGDDAEATTESRGRYNISSSSNHEERNQEHSQENNDYDEDDDSLADPNDSTRALLYASNANSRYSSPTNPPTSPSSSSSPPHRTHEELTAVKLGLSTQISSKGIGIGYCAALFVQCIGILILFKMHSTTWSQRVVLFVVGTWWAIFTIPAAMWLRPRPGPPLPATATSLATSSPASSATILGRLYAGAVYLAFAWRSLFRTISYARRLIDIVLFLAAWFLLSDAIATTSSTAILFAKTQLHMEVWAIGLISVISTATGIVGAFSWAYISRRLDLKPLQTILACLVLFELIPLYGLAGYLPFVRSWGVLGLQQPWEMYPLAAVYGFVMGGLSSYCRSLYGELIPPGSETAFYALYAITDKGSSVFGPAIVGAIIDMTGEIRPAFWFLACVVGVPMPLFYLVNVARGKHEGEQLAAYIEGLEDNSGLQGGEDGEDDDDYDETESSHTPRPILDYSGSDDPEPPRHR